MEAADAAPGGKVVGIALKTGDMAPMREVTEARAVIDVGLEGNAKNTPDRSLTLISAPQWRDVVAALGTELPWHTRRANVLVDIRGLDQFIGRTIAVGEALVEIKAETRPCGLMDQLHDGLRKALEPECRGGIYGRIVRGGMIRVGDAVRLCPHAATTSA